VSLLYHKWNWDDALAVAREEGREDGLEEGREEGLEEGIEKGLEKGHFNEKLEIARNLLAEGSTLEFVQKITGLDIETIQNL
jgi:predicted transposase/invertase (TIGR01784 family)